MDFADLVPEGTILNVADLHDKLDRLALSETVAETAKKGYDDITQKMFSATRGTFFSIKWRYER
jgi:hypothetical protein